MDVTFTTLGAVIGLVIAIVLIIKKVNPAYSLILGALIGGLIGGGVGPPHLNERHSRGRPDQDRLRAEDCRDDCR